jgi:hypothetical protein
MLTHPFGLPCRKFLHLATSAGALPLTWSVARADGRDIWPLVLETMTMLGDRYRITSSAVASSVSGMLIVRGS